MALEETRYKTEVSHKVTSRLSDLFPTQTLQAGDLEFWDRGFALAHFLFPDRTTATAIFIGALNKLKVRSHQERKRAYWRDKFLKRQISRITRNDEDTLQWLIYFHSDFYEKAQEHLGRASEQDIVVRYLKTLVGFSTAMSSFYVNIAIHRLLYRYTTSEAQKIYEMVTDRYRETDEYRRAKRILMQKLEMRFGNRIQSIHADHGELKYELSENQEAWHELVLNCLKLFIPWSTQDKCPVKHQSVTFSHRSHEVFGGNFVETDNQDKIEINRCHAFIDPLCAGYIVDALGLEKHSAKLGVPRFYMDPDENLHPPSLRLPDSPLTAQERQAIADALAVEEARRRTATARELRLVVDGVEHARLYPEHSRELRFCVSPACQLLEVWTEDEQGPLLLATHTTSAPDFTHGVQSGFTLILNGSRSVSISIVSTLNGPEEDASSCTISVSVKEARHEIKASRIQEWLARVPGLPAYAGMLALLLAVIFLWTGLRQKLATEQLQENDLRVELTREKESRTSSQQTRTPIPGPPTYRLTPDDLITRGDEIEEHAVTVPSIPMVINLQCAIPKGTGQYHVALKRLDGRKIILAEDALSPIPQENETIIVVSVPSTLLVPSQYYRLELQDTTSRGIRTFTFYTMPAHP
jgi:hypothetical protein